LARSDKVDDPFAALESVLAQQQSLRTELHPLGIVSARRNVWSAATLVVDGRDAVAFALHQIELRRDAQTRRGQGNRARMNGLAFARVLGQRAALLIDAAVLDRPVDRIGTVREFALHPFEIRKP